MAYVTNVTGPDYKGNYQAQMSDGVVITFGPVQDPRHASPDDPSMNWFVSLPSGSNDHTSYIVSTRNGIWQSNSEWMINAVKENGADKGAWQLYASTIVNGILR